MLSDEANPDRKLPFDIRSVMRAVVDADHAPLERWAGMRDAEASVVWHAHLGGWPVTLLGIESHPLPRAGALPADGPEQWTSGTLFPRSAKKVARAINAASGRVPVVVLANLAGFDGSPESMRELQLEFGAEIGRAVVNFRGPIVFCVVSRYHGGAFVVFSQRLNEQLETVAVEGAHASVIGGSAAAAVVFARDVDAATRADPRDRALDARIEAAEGAERAALRAERAARWTEVRAEKMGEFAARFDAAHSVERAVRMGSVELDRRPRGAAAVPDRGRRARDAPHGGAHERPPDDRGARRPRARARQPGMKAGVAGGALTTARRDRWWWPPLATGLGLAAFGAYAAIAVLLGDNYRYTKAAPTTCRRSTRRISRAGGSTCRSRRRSSCIWVPLGFRATCYYYRKAYYRAFFLSPPACAVRPRRDGRYRGEAAFPLHPQERPPLLPLPRHDRARLPLVRRRPRVLLRRRVRRVGRRLARAARQRDPAVAVHVRLQLGPPPGRRPARLLHVLGARAGAPQRRGAASGVLNVRHMEWAWISLIWVGARRPLRPAGRVRRLRRSEDRLRCARDATTTTWS